MVPNNISQLTGLHLFYHPYSNCAQRVMLLCAEKNLSPVMHKIDLMRGEQLSESYRVINPSCDVPAIVHDGLAMGDSVSIMRYLEKTYPQVSLTPQSVTEHEEMERLLDEASMSHMRAVVPFVYAFDFGRLPTSEQKMFYDRYVPHRANFHNERLAGKVACDKKKAQQVVDSQFEMLESILSHRPWLAGSSYSMADIAWFTNTILLRTFGYTLPDVPHVKKWISAIEQRAAYRVGIKSQLLPIPSWMIRSVWKLIRRRHELS